MLLQIAMDQMPGMAQTVATMDMSATMTHYMELLQTNQPWNLILFMAIPVILAETLTATEFFVIFNRLYEGPLKTFNKWIGSLLGIYFLGIFLYLMVFVVPSIQWRGIIDVISVAAYLSGVIFLFGITLLDTRVIGKGLDKEKSMKYHFLLLIGFLVVAHVAMIFGMANPTLI
jgi:hypothetical protein